MTLLKIVEVNIFIQLNIDVYDIKFKNFTNNEEVNLTISIAFIEFKSQFYGLSKKIEMQDTRV